MPKLNILGGSGEGRSLNVNASRSINLYPDLDADPESKAVISLTKTPGCSLWAQLGVGPNRGQHVFNNLLFVVSGNELHSVTPEGVISPSLGTLATVTTRVSMANNGLKSAGVGGDQLAIADGTKLYIYNVVTGVFSTPTVSIDAPCHVEYIDGYFIVTNQTMTAAASNIYDGTTFNPLAVTPVEAAPDNIQAAISIYQQLLFVKQYTSEFFYDAAVPTSTGFPFARVPGGVIPYGTSAKWSVCRGAGSVFWLADQWTENGGEFVGPYMLNGTSPVPIGTPAIIYRMSLWADRANAFSFCYCEGGHTFVFFTSPGDNQTFVYDTTTQMWHERSTYTDNPYQVNRHVSNSYAFFNGMHLIGDYQSGNIYAMGSDRYTDYGLPIVWVRRTNHLFDQTNFDNYFVNELQLDLDVAVKMNHPASGSSVTLTVDAVYSFTPPSDPGWDYTQDVPVTFVATDGNGSGGAGMGVASFGGIRSVSLTARGTGYDREPEAVFSDPVITPTISLASSKDGGHTWGSERIKPATSRVVFTRLGMARDRVWEIRGSDPVGVVLLGGYAEVDK